MDELLGPESAGQFHPAVMHVWDDKVLLHGFHIVSHYLQQQGKLVPIQDRTSYILLNKETKHLPIQIQTMGNTLHFLIGAYEK